MNSCVPMSRYGMPSSNSSATSRSRSDSLVDAGRVGPGWSVDRGGSVQVRRRIKRGGLLEVAGQLQHRAGDAPVGSVQRRLAGQPGGIPGEAELRQRPRRGADFVGVDVVGEHPQPGAAGVDKRLGEGALGRRRRSAPDRAAQRLRGNWPGFPHARRPNATAPTTAAGCRASPAARTPRRGCAAVGRPGASGPRPPTTRPVAAVRTGRSNIRRALRSPRTNASAPLRCRRFGVRSPSAAPPPTAHRAGAALP